jgi:hypothetical protein
MSLSAWVNSRVETECSQLLNDISHVVVKVTTYDYRSSGVLPDDVSGDLDHPFGSFLQVLLFARLKIAVENLNIFAAELQLGPTEIGAKCLHQLQSGVGSRSIPTSTTALSHGLERPEPIKIHG